MPSVEQIRAGRPSEPGFARVVLIIAVLLWLPVAGFLYTTSAEFAALALFLVVFGAFGVVKGRLAGRVMTTVALAYVYFALAPYCWLGFRDPYPYSSVYAIIDIVAVALSVVALTQLYHPNTNRYVRMVTAVRRG